MKYKCRITFDYDGNTANAKSVLSVLGACIKCGTEITLVCDGEDESQALTDLLRSLWELASLRTSMHWSGRPWAFVRGLSLHRHVP